MTKRAICPNCLYPQSACICAAIKKMTAQTEVIVMQHPSETKHAKNSVRLMQLVMPKLRVEVGENQQDFVELRAYLSEQSKPIYLLYPNDNSQSAAEANAPKDCILLLLDGTWKKAYRMLQLNPWLLELSALHLDVANASKYTIRKAKREDSLSTLEATAIMLNELDRQLDTQPLFAALEAMVQHRLQAMPKDVQQRYQTK
ncbi:DTW domain-containing protein [Shewanella maritima]|uniref:tRNA-uridine aminocarboxypropyltransferase n=1 Tax=Shewanella maritima TaxID=2520507 RepID=A0A411PI60_9GAMM|nr:tRNA-uridine aminocarboxypropyltransferase [Shewanella maritima]QBF83287.1 DTW domain-containing protein [Shewanella maritima]